MHIRYHLPKEFYQLVKRRPPQLSPQAKSRQQTLIAWEALRKAGIPAKQAGYMLHAPRSSLYRWYKRWLEKGARGLEYRSRRPKRLRCVSWSPELIEAGIARNLPALGQG